MIAKQRCVKTITETLAALREMLLLTAVQSLRAPPCIPIDVQPSTGRGLGAFAASAISAGALVCSYDGERITQQEVQERYDSTAGGDYLFEVRKPSADRDGLYLDAERGAHASRFINHAEHGLSLIHI